MRLVLALATIGLASGCGGRVEGDVGDAGAVAEGAGDAVVGTDWIRFPPILLCEPYEVQECLPELSKKALVCNARGNALKETTCTGEHGDSQCRDGACTECFPGVKRCAGEATVLRCSEDGSSWEHEQSCNPQVSGQVCLGGECVNLCDENVKNSSYIGCDFFAVDLENIFWPSPWERGYTDAAGAQFAVVVANPVTSPAAADVDVTWFENGAEEAVPFDSAGQPLADGLLLPGSVRVYELPRRDVRGTILEPIAYRVRSSVPVVAYQFNPLANELVYSNDASMLVPAPLTDTSYIVLGTPQEGDLGRSSVTVVAVLPGTTVVSVTSTFVTSASKEGDVAPLAPGDTGVFELEQYDVLNLSSGAAGADPTGTVVFSDKRVAVFGGSDCASIPYIGACVKDGDGAAKVCAWDGETPCESPNDCQKAGFDVCCCDHLEHQLLPVSLWGTHYVAAKAWPRGDEEDVWRVVAAENGTQVFTTPSQGPPVVLQRGEFFELSSRDDFEIRSTDPQKPIGVGHYLAGQQAPPQKPQGSPPAVAAGTGDPAFSIGIPVELWREDFVFFVPEEYAHNYVTVVTAPGAEVSLDGNLLSPDDFEPIAPGDHAAARFELPTTGAHVLVSSEPAFVEVYGFDQYVSYAYPAGMKLGP